MRVPPNIRGTTVLPKSSEELFAFLEGLGIRTTTRTHEPLFTVADSQRLRGEIPGAHTKNLFLKDKKNNYFLLTVEEEASVDLKSVHQSIGAASRVSFGKPEALMELLGVAPGAVTVFGAINDAVGRVKIVIDQSLAAEPLINAHPLVNTATTTISSADLLAFVRATGHDPLVLNLAGGTPHGGPTG
jgi:Ala-tRNA(Pro) deacylase